MSGVCEFGNELSVSIKCGQFLGQLKTCQLLNKDSAPWSLVTVKHLFCNKYQDVPCVCVCMVII